MLREILLYVKSAAKGGNNLDRRDRLSRLLEMFFTIQAKPGLSAAELARRFEVSTRQCYRDLKALQEGGVALYNDQGYRLLKGTVLKDVTFSLEEAIALIYGLKLIEQQKGLSDASADALKKLLARFPLGLWDELKSIDQRVEIDVSPAADYSAKGPLFRKIDEAIQEQIIIQIDYYSFSRNKVTAREVDPYKLVYKDGFWYLVAFCHQRDKVLIFRVDRIHRLAITSKHFTLPDDFDYEEYMGSAWQMERGEEFCFKVRFFGDAARFVKETHFHPSQKISQEQGGTLLFKARASGMRSVLRWVLPFGTEAEVLEPPELREMIAQVMVEGARRYKAEEKQPMKEEWQKVGLTRGFWDNPIDDAVWNRD